SAAAAIDPTVQRKNHAASIGRTTRRSARKELMAGLQIVSHLSAASPEAARREVEEQYCRLVRRVKNFRQRQNTTVNFWVNLVDLVGFEPTTSSMPFLILECSRTTRTKCD